MPRRRAIAILPNAAALVAKSTTIAGSSSPGNAIAIGLVPNMRPVPENVARRLQHARAELAQRTGRVGGPFRHRELGGARRISCARAPDLAAPGHQISRRFPCAHPLSMNSPGGQMSQTPPAQPAEPPIHTGIALGRYQVQEFLGQGAHGPTYRAYDPHVARSAV